MQRFCKVKKSRPIKIQNWKFKFSKKEYTCQETAISLLTIDIADSVDRHGNREG